MDGGSVVRMQGSTLQILEDSSENILVREASSSLMLLTGRLSFFWWIVADTDRPGWLPLVTNARRTFRSKNRFEAHCKRSWCLQHTELQRGTDHTENHGFQVPVPIALQHISRVPHRFSLNSPGKAQCVGLRAVLLGLRDASCSPSSQT